MRMTLGMIVLLLWLAILPTSCSQGVERNSSMRHMGDCSDLEYWPNPPRKAGEKGMAGTPGEGSPDCTHDDACGWNSFCDDGQCGCIPGHKWSINKHDCWDVRCHDSRCLECTSPGKCRRCADFIEEGTGRCLDVCHGSYMLVVEGVHVGRVCPVAGRTSMVRIYVAVIIGVGAGVLMTGIAALCFYLQSKQYGSKKKKPRPPSRHEIEKAQTAGNLNNTFGSVYANGHIPNGHPSGSIPNGPTSSSPPPRPREPQPTIDLSVFEYQVAHLRPYIDTFISMVREVKLRNRELHPDDNRAFVYKNVVHQLCRVVTILNTDKECLEIPPDGVLLLRWSDSLLEKYLSIKDPEYWEPGSPVGTLTSTFKPDHRLIPNGDAAQGNTNTDGTFKYERYDPDELNVDQVDYKNLSIQLGDDFTEPIEV